MKTSLLKSVKHRTLLSDAYFPVSFRAQQRTKYNSLQLMHSQLYRSYKVSPTLYQSDSRISNHRGHKFPPSQTLHSTRSDARAKFDSGVIFLNQVKFFVCIDNRLRQMAFFVFVKVGGVRGKGRLLSHVERF